MPSVSGMCYYVLASLPLPLSCWIIGMAVVSVYMFFKNLLYSSYELPKLVYMDSALAQFVLKKCPSLTQPYIPPVWAKGGHIQTLLPVLLPKETLVYEREFLQMKDKGVIALDWCVPKEGSGKRLKKSSPVLLVLHGYTGETPGVISLIKEAHAKGFRSVVFNKRGHGGCPLTTPKLQSFGDPTDLRQVVKYIRGRFHHARIVAVGYSAGSGLLVSYLGEYGSSAYLSAGVCVSPGYDAEKLMKRGFRQPYDLFLLFSLKQVLSKHALALSKCIDIETAFRCKTVPEFEEAVYSKLYGYKNMEEYWENNNPMRDIDDISVPVLSINSLDDPICVAENIPVDLFKDMPNFFLCATQHGGHCGFLESKNLDCWSDKLALEYLCAVLEFIKNGEKDGN